MSTLEKELNELVDYLNENYNQDSDNYNIIFGSKPGIIEYNDHITISLWGCGAIACIYDQIFFISEDDGNWWVNSEEKEYIVIIYGDVNGDGKISSADYIKIKNHIMETNKLTNLEKEYADANKDGKVSSADYIAIKNHIMEVSKIIQ